MIHPSARSEMMRFNAFDFWRSAVGRLSALVILTSLALSGGAARAHASAALLLEMPYGGLGTFNPTGHAALYFDHLCAATPLKLRPCNPGELGVVISRYDGIGDYDWVAVPLMPYLYAVETADQIPSTMDRLTALRMRDLYRRKHLESVAPDAADGAMPQGNWYELAGSAFDRSIYGFQVKTTPEQDEALIDYFNDRPNVTRYQGAFRNCADFTRIVLNRLYPHAVRRNYVADFGLTTPKSVARGLVHYGRKHPEMDLTMFRVPQLDGTIPRSMSIQGVTGSLLTRYGVPMAILSPHVTAVVLVAYVGKGRFAVPKDAPVLDVAELESAAAAEALRQQTLVAEDAGAKDDSAAPSTPVADNLTAVSLTGGSDSSGPAIGLVCDGMCDTIPFLP